MGGSRWVLLGSQAYTGRDLGVEIFLGGVFSPRSMHLTDCRAGFYGARPCQSAGTGVQRVCLGCGWCVLLYALLLSAQALLVARWFVFPTKEGHG
jgi:hypothetical protein